jgi:uncharacterized protein YwgA
MEQSERAAVIAQLLGALKGRGSWCGETHVQKAVYFLQELSDVPLGYTFVLYKHGPFSFDLRDELGVFRAYGFLVVRPQPAPYGPSWEVSDSGRQLMQNSADVLRRFSDSINFVVARVGDKGVAQLERLATALYVDNSLDSSVPVHEKAAAVNRMKPHVSEDAAEEALKVIAEMRHCLESAPLS